MPPNIFLACCCLAFFSKQCMQNLLLVFLRFISRPQITHFRFFIVNTSFLFLLFTFLKPFVIQKASRKRKQTNPSLIIIKKQNFVNTLNVDNFCYPSIVPMVEVLTSILEHAIAKAIILSVSKFLSSR